MQPVVGESGAPDESGFTIDDQQLPVGTVVDARSTAPAQWMIELNPAASLEQFFQVAFRRGEAPDGVQHHVHPHSGTRAFCQRADKPACDLTLLKDVGFKINAAAGFTNGFEFSFVRVLSIGMDSQQAGMIHLGVSKGLDGAQERL